MRTKSEEVLPDVGEFELELYNSNSIRLYRDSYSNSIGKRIRLNAGDFRLLAQWGDSLGTGFNKPWYAADTTFTVHGQTVEQVKATARMKKVKVAVKYGNNLVDGYEEYYSLVRTAKPTLRFEKNETRAGYFPVDSVRYQLYAKLGGKLMYYALPAVAANGGDFITFNVDAPQREGDLNVTIQIDNAMETITKEFTIPSLAIPSGAPTITSDGISQDKPIEFVKGESLTGKKFDFWAQGGIASCIVTFESSSLSVLGLPSQLDLMNLSASEGQRLRDLGFVWGFISDGTDSEPLLGYFGLNDIADKFPVDPANLINARIGFTVVDTKGRTSSTPKYELQQHHAEFSFNIDDTSVWARRVEDLKVSYLGDRTSLLKFQYRKGTDAWTTIAPTSTLPEAVSERTDFLYGNLGGLEPFTTYQFRLIYNDNPDLTSPTVTVKTEHDSQPGNPGFEQWQQKEFSYKVILGSSYTRLWYWPWEQNESDIWWAVNSKVTMLSSIAAAYHELKVTPTVFYSSDAHEGNRSAELVSTGVGAAASMVGALSTKAPGILGTGSMDANGNATFGYHIFGSRPDVLSIWYKFDQYNNESGIAEIKLMANDGTTVIGEGSALISASASSWTKLNVPVTYSVRNKKAGYVYVQFKSSTAGTPDVKITKAIDYPEGSRNSAAGCVLKVDQVEFIYEQ